MRIIAGAAKGRRLHAPERGTRPLTARTKEAVFSSLSGAVIDARVADLFAGSGALGFEALSRGAGSVVFVDKAWPAVKAIMKNRDRLQLHGEIVAEPVDTFLKETEDRFDLVFVDPPFEFESVELVKVLDRVAERLDPGGIVVVHRRAGTEADLNVPGCDLRWRRRYGDGDVFLFDRVRS